MFQYSRVFIRRGREYRVVMADEHVISQELLRVLRCPVTLSALREEGGWLVGEIGGLRYPVRDGIPVMLAEEAKLPEGIGSLDEFRAKFGRQR